MKNLEKSRKDIKPTFHKKEQEFILKNNIIEYVILLSSVIIQFLFKPNKQIANQKVTSLLNLITRNYAYISFLLFSLISYLLKVFFLLYLVCYLFASFLSRFNNMFNNIVAR